MCEIVYNILITNFTVHRCIIRSNAPSNLQMQPLGCIFVYALNCITFGTAIDSSCGTGGFLVTAMTHVIAQLEAEFSEQIGLPQKDWDYDTKKLFQEKISDMAAHNYFGFDILTLIL